MNFRNTEIIASILRNEYDDFNHYNRKNPLEELLLIICSVQTDEEKYLYAFKQLKNSYSTFEEIAAANRKDIAKSIEMSGLADQKATYIAESIKIITETFGRPSLSALNNYDDCDCERFLLGLPGVGKKVARCIMLYSLNREVFPVDTNCWRVSRRLGWVRPTRTDKRCSPRDMDRLQDKIPSELRYSLHVNMVSLGRDVCVGGRPDCTRCPVSDYCRRIGVRTTGITKA